MEAVALSDNDAVTLGVIDGDTVGEGVEDALGVGDEDELGATKSNIFSDDRAVASGTDIKRYLPSSPSSPTLPPVPCIPPNNVVLENEEFDVVDNNTPPPPPPIGILKKIEFVEKYKYSNYLHLQLHQNYWHHLLLQHQPIDLPNQYHSNQNQKLLTQFHQLHLNMC